MAKKINAFDAKTHLSSLLRDAERGESYVIHRRGKPVAKLGPAREEDGWLSIAQAFREMRKRLGPAMDVKSLIEEGRRL